MIFDPRSSLAHNLDALTSQVLRKCDGKTPQTDVAQEIGPKVLEEALELLAQQRLIDLEPQGPLAAKSRREFLKAAGVSLPVIATLMTPLPAAAGSVCVNCGTLPFNCGGSGCTGINGGCARCETNSNPCPGADCVCLSNKIRDGSNCATDSVSFSTNACVNLNGPVNSLRVQSNCTAARNATIANPTGDTTFTLCNGATSNVFTNEYFCCEGC